VATDSTVVEDRPDIQKIQEGPEKDPSTSVRPIDRRSRQGPSFALAGFALISVLFNLRNLFSEGIPVHGDLTFPWSLTNYLNNYLYLFTDSGSVSNFESVDRALVLLPLSALAHILGLGTDFVHLAVFLAVPFISMTTAYFLNRYVVDRMSEKSVGILPIFFASIVYGLSPWVMEQMQAYLFWLAYALTPALVLLSFKFIERPNWRSALGIALVMSLIAATPHYLAFSIVILILVWTLSNVLWPRRSLRDPNHVKKTLGWGLLATLAFVAINAYWLFPLSVAFASAGAIGPGYEATSAMTEMFSTNSSLLNVMRGYDQWIIWYAADQRMGFVFSPLWVAVSLFLPAVAISTLLIPSVRRSKEIRVLAMLGAMFGFLALGTTTPIYDWLVFDAPLISNVGWLLRVPGKLSYVPWLFYTAAFAWIFSHLLQIPRRSIGITACVVLVASLMVVLLPKAIIYFSDYYAPVKKPHSYQQLETFLASEGETHVRVIYLAPYASAFGRNRLRFETSFKWAPGHLAAATPVHSSPLPSIGYYHLTLRDWQVTLFRRLESEIPADVGRRLLSRVGVKYLVYHNDIVAGQPQAKRDLRDLRSSDLTMEREFGNISVWSNPFESSIFGNGSDRLDEEKLDPTRYRIDLSDPILGEIEMGQPYDPLWVARWREEEFLPRKTSDGYMAFDLPAGATGEIKVEYRPQDAYEVGLKLSAASLTIVVLVLLLGLRKRDLG
jgi:hypothetical protein